MPPVARVETFIWYLTQDEGYLSCTLYLVPCTLYLVPCCADCRSSCFLLRVRASVKLDGDPGCDPADTQTGHPQGLAALANVSAHELSETRTDPGFNGAFGGWYDASGAENGDKCAWTFNIPYVSFQNGTIWKLQGEWSNAAYNAGTGYPNSSGQKGCLSGQ